MAGPCFLPLLRGKQRGLKSTQMEFTFGIEIMTSTINVNLLKMIRIKKSDFTKEFVNQINTIKILNPCFKLIDLTKTDKVE